MSWDGCPTTLFRAIKVQGKVLCIDSRVLSETTKVVRSRDEYDKARSEGWCDEPSEALEHFERDEEAVSRAAAERAYTDLRMSDSAQREAADYEAGVSAHVPVIPEARR